MPDENQRTYLFAAIDRATRWVYVEILKDKTARSARGSLERLTEKAPFKITRRLTDHGKAFTDCFGVASPRRLTGKHPFDLRACTVHPWIA